MIEPGADVIKLFFSFLLTLWTNELGCSSLASLVQLSIMFASMAGAYPRGAFYRVDSRPVPETLDHGLSP